MNLTGLLNFQTPLFAEELKETDQVLVFMASSLKAVIEEIFVKSASSFLIVCSCRRQSSCYFIRSLMQALFSIIYLNVQIIYIDHKSPRHVFSSSVHNLLLVDSFEAFLNIDIMSFSEEFSNDKYYHILLLQREQYVQQDMKSIFNYCWQNSIINCNIQHYNAKGEIFLYTYFPFIYNKCGNYEPQQIDTFIGKSWTNKTYFHRKLDNFQGCPLKVAVRYAPPYAYVSIGADGNLYYNGFEIDMVKYIATKMNFTLHLPTRTPNNRTIRYDKETLKMVTERKADIALGFYQRTGKNSNQFSTTFTHLQTKVVAILNMPAHLLTTFEVLLYPFEDFVWYVLTLSMVTVLMITRLMRINQTQQLSLFSMITCAIGLPIQDIPKRPHSVLIFITWLWCSFLMRTTYTDLWFQLLRRKVYSFKPRTLSEPVDKNFQAVMTMHTYNDIQNISVFRNTLNSTSIVLSSNDETSTLSYLQKSNIKDLFAVTYIDIFTHFLRNSSYNQRDIFYVVPETVVQHQLCLYMTKHSYLISQFDFVLMVLKSTGLMQFLSRKHFYYGIKNEKYYDSFFIQNDLWGIYVVCCVLNFLAFIIFLIEILSRKVTFLARLFN